MFEDVFSLTSLKMNHLITLSLNSGLQEAKGLHSYSGTLATYLPRLLAHGVGAKHKCHCHDHQLDGERKGELAMITG